MLDYAGKILGAKSKACITPMILVHANIAAYAAAYWLQQPVLPFLSKELGADPSTFGQLQSAISALAVIGAPAMGWLTDAKGPKVAIIVAQAAGLLMYTLTWSATSLRMLFASRVPGLLLHCMLCSQAAIAKLSLEETRAAALGRLSLSYGLGMVPGSLLGGIISSKFGHHATALAAALLTGAIVLADIVLLPSLEPGQRSERRDVTKSETIGSGWRGVLSSPAVAAVVAFSLVIGVGLSTSQSMLALGMNERFGVEASGLGFFMTFSALVGLVTNTLLVQPLVQCTGETHLLWTAALVLAAAMIAMSQCDSLDQLIAFSMPSTAASTVLYTVQGSILTKSVEKTQSGAAMSLAHATRTVCGVVAPLVGGVVLQSQGFPGLMLFASGCASCAALLMLVWGRKAIESAAMSVAGVNGKHN